MHFVFWRFCFLRGLRKESNPPTPKGGLAKFEIRNIKMKLTIETVSYKLPIILLLAICISSCMENKEKASFKLFNEGVKFSLEARDIFEKGKIEPALELNKKAFDKFLETYKIDSSHQLVKSALGHSYYLQKDYKQGVYWYELATKLDSPLAVSYRELGLCRINLGDIENGESDLKKSLQLDKSIENKQITILDLKDIGELAFEYGEDYEKEGDNAKGLGYKKFAIGVLWLASNLDTSNLDIKNKLAEFAEKIGDFETSKKFKAK